MLMTLKDTSAVLYRVVYKTLESVEPISPVVFTGVFAFAMLNGGVQADLSVSGLCVAVRFMLACDYVACIFTPIRCFANYLLFNI
jgi:hypothetical protein